MKKGETIKEALARAYERTPLGKVIERQKREELRECLIETSGKHSGGKASQSTFTGPAGSTRNAPNAPPEPDTATTAKPRSSASTSDRAAPSSGTATTANGEVPPTLTVAHARRLKERGLNPALCAQLGVHSVDPRTLGFHYFVNGAVHNTKLRRGKGNMPWANAGRELVLWNIDCLKGDPAPDEEVVITEGEFDAVAFIQAGLSRVVSVPNGAQDGDQGFKFLYGKDGELHPDLEKFKRFVLATDGDRKGRGCRDALAVRLGDERCRWVSYPPGAKDANDTLLATGLESVSAIVAAARPMWTEEVATIDDIPDPPEEQVFKLGIEELDNHGMRITLPCLMVLLGPYSAGKSVLLRQLLCGFWKLYGWRFLLTSFEEPVKPRYQRDLRRHFIGKHPAEWTAADLAEADDEIKRSAVFFRRPRGVELTPELVLDRIEYAVKVYGVRTVAIDPVNRLFMRVQDGRMKTDVMGSFFDALRDLGDDYGLYTIVLGHTSQAKSEKRLKRDGLLTLNDGEDTRHWGGMSDIGWVMWRDLDSPSMLHIERTKDHATMGEPTLCRLAFDKALGRFSVDRMGYDILSSKEKVQ